MTPEAETETGTSSKSPEVPHVDVITLDDDWILHHEQQGMLIPNQVCLQRIVKFIHSFYTFIVYFSISSYNKFSFIIYWILEWIFSKLHTFILRIHSVLILCFCRYLMKPFSASNLSFIITARVVITYKLIIMGCSLSIFSYCGHITGWLKHAKITKISINYSILFRFFCLILDLAKFCLHIFRILF